MLKLLHIKWFENHDSYLFLIFAYLQRVLNLFMIFTNTISMDFTSFCIYFYWYCNIMLLGWQECYTVHYLFCMQIRKMDNNFVSAFFFYYPAGRFRVRACHFGQVQWRHKSSLVNGKVGFEADWHARTVWWTQIPRWKCQGTVFKFTKEPNLLWGEMFLCILNNVRGFANLPKFEYYVIFFDFFSTPQNWEVLLVKVVFLTNKKSVFSVLSS